TTTAATGSAWFNTSDLYDVDGTTQPLISGTTTFAVRMLTVGSQTLSVFPVGTTYATGTVSGIPITAGAANRLPVPLPGESITALAPALINPNYTTPSLTVNPDTTGPKKIRLILPGETRAPGTVAGKSGSPTGPGAGGHFIAGQPVAMSLDATDTWGNILSNT